jgi:hypothetical protein
MTAVFGHLELDHYNVGVAIQTEQVDAPQTCVPFAEFLTEYEQIGVEDLDLIAKQTLKTVPLIDLLAYESRVRSGALLPGW